MNKKWAYVLAGLSVILIAVSFYFGRSGDACRRINYYEALANNELAAAPPGVERVDTFLKRLCAIDMRGAPQNVRDAMEDYIVTFEQALKELRDSGRAGPADKEIGQKQKALAEAMASCE